MYAMRFPDPLDPGLTLQQIRGKEGMRVRAAYARASEETGVPWHGRAYQQGAWAAADPVNRALSAANSCLYGICHAAIESAGFSPAIGFVHTGRMLSFVYDVADLSTVWVEAQVYEDEIGFLREGLAVAATTKATWAVLAVRLADDFADAGRDEYARQGAQEAFRRDPRTAITLARVSDLSVQSGRVRANVEESSAVLRQRRAEREDLRGRMKE